MSFVLSGEMLLWEAVSNRELADVKRLLANGGDPNMRCPDSFVRLHASEKFRSGQAQNTGRSLLHHAAWAGDLEVFKAIVEAGGDIDHKRNTVWRPNGGVNGRGNKPLHFAVMYRRVDIVRYLLDLGADINAAGEQGYTPLHISVKFNYPELMELLLLAGARTDMITRDEKTARDLAKWGGENTTEAMGDILELFDRCEMECRARGAAVGQRYEPGAPLQPLEPWLHGSSGRRGGAPLLGGGTTVGKQLSPEPDLEPRISPGGFHQVPMKRKLPYSSSGRSGGPGGAGDSLDDWYREGPSSSCVPERDLGTQFGSSRGPVANSLGRAGTQLDRHQHQPHEQSKVAQGGPMSTRPW